MAHVEKMADGYSATSGGSAKKADDNPGVLSRLEIEPADNGGFIVRTHYKAKPSKKSDLTMATYVDPTVKVTTTRKALDAILNDALGVDVAGASLVTPRKAREIVKDGTVHGKPLTAPQRRLFQGIAHGWTPTGKAAE